MTVFRVVMVLVLGGLLAGCMDRLQSDYRLVKADAGALKRYLRASPAPDDCPPPGEKEEARICKYRFKITTVDGDLHRGTVAESVVKHGKKACEDTKKFLLDKNLATAEELKAYPCFDPDPNATYPEVPYNYAVYAFAIEEGPADKTVLKDKVVNLENIPGKKSLKYKGLCDRTCEDQDPMNWR